MPLKKLCASVVKKIKYGSAMLNPKLSILNINTSQEQNQEPPLLYKIKNKRKDKVKLHLYCQ
ncbi:hypothetical protein SAMN05443429_101461 [Cruoricaptor ignavus]|uniref:Uncharacterized protein n=1 Tax=Cruoricaptor ignavus TaxID=1118202 RepID=A0A1M6AY89_9FLAO|nr:hypothetical protein SAMN05443429_101461 [Cruoricaptor ignavus]